MIVYKIKAIRKRRMGVALKVNMPMESSFITMTSAEC